jgi:hypothetical protein
VIRTKPKFADDRNRTEAKKKEKESRIFEGYDQNKYLELKI